jgi:hypothetical protein
MGGKMENTLLFLTFNLAVNWCCLTISFYTPAAQIMKELKPFYLQIGEPLLHVKSQRLLINCIDCVVVICLSPSLITAGTARQALHCPFFKLFHCCWNALPLCFLEYCWSQNPENSHAR